MAPATAPHEAQTGVPTVPTDTIQDIRLDAIEPSPLNPRREFGQESLEELAASLRIDGLIQPIVVRPISATRFSLLAGERRWRAAHLVPWETITALIRTEEDDGKALATMLAENLQREDLTAIEQAHAFKRLQELKVSQTEIARLARKSQPTVANTLRLLQLPESVQALVQSRALAPANARALLPLAAFPEVAQAMAERVIAQEIPARVLERDCLATREWELAAAGVVRGLDDRTPWDWRTVCRESCPFAAFREVSGGRGAVCLKPAHYDELAAAAGELAPVPAATTVAALRSTADQAEREQRAALWDDCRRVLESRLALDDRRLVALLCVDLIAATKHETVKWLSQSIAIPAALLAALLAAEPTRLGIAQALAAEPAAWVAKLALLCLLRTEAEEAANHRHPARLAEWVTGAPDEDGSVGQRLSELLAPDAAA